MNARFLLNLNVSKKARLDVITWLCKPVTCNGCLLLESRAIGLSDFTSAALAGCRDRSVLAVHLNSCTCSDVWCFGALHDD